MAEQLTSSTSLNTEPKRKRTPKGLPENLIIDFPLLTDKGLYFSEDLHNRPRSDLLVRGVFIVSQWLELWM